MGRRAKRVGVGVCFAGMFLGMFRGMFRGYVSGMFRGIMSYFACNFGGMLRGMFRGYVSGYVSWVCNPCALLKPEPPKKTQTHLSFTRELCGLTAFDVLPQSGHHAPGGSLRHAPGVGHGLGVVHREILRIVQMMGT